MQWNTLNTGKVNLFGVISNEQKRRMAVQKTGIGASKRNHNQDGNITDFYNSHGLRPRLSNSKGRNW